MQRVWFSSASCPPKGLPVFPLRLAYPLLRVQRYWVGLRDLKSAHRPLRQRPQSRSSFLLESLFQLKGDGDEPPDCWANTS